MLDNLIDGTIPTRIQALAILSSLILLGFVIHLIKKEKLKEGYSIIWFLIGSALVLFSAFSGLLDIFAHAVGIAYAPAALLIILAGGLLLLGLHFSVLISSQDRRLRELAQEHALLKQRVRHNNTGPPKQKSAVGVSKAVTASLIPNTRLKQKTHA